MQCCSYFLGKVPFACVYFSPNRLGKPPCSKLSLQKIWRSKFTWCAAILRTLLEARINTTVARMNLSPPLPHLYLEQSYRHDVANILSLSPLAIRRVPGPQNIYQTTQQPSSVRAPQKMTQSFAHHAVGLVVVDKCNSNECHSLLRMIQGSDKASLRRELLVEWANTVRRESRKKGSLYSVLVNKAQTADCRGPKWCLSTCGHNAKSTVVRLRCPGI